MKPDVAPNVDPVGQRAFDVALGERCKTKRLSVRQAKVGGRGELPIQPKPPHWTGILREDSWIDVVLEADTARNLPSAMGPFNLVKLSDVERQEFNAWIQTGEGLLHGSKATHLHREVQSECPGIPVLPHAQGACHSRLGT